MARKTMMAEGACSATAMRKASRRLTALYDGALEPVGLRSTQYAILVELDARAKAPPTLSELASALVMDRSALGHNLRPLERDNLIQLKIGDVDRRQRHIVLTDEGKAKLKQARPFWRNAQERFNDVYGAADASALRTKLLGIAYNERLGAFAD